MKMRTYVVVGAVALASAGAAGVFSSLAAADAPPKKATSAEKTGSANRSAGQQRAKTADAEIRAMCEVCDSLPAEQLCSANVAYRSDAGQTSDGGIRGEYPPPRPDLHEACSLPPCTPPRITDASSTRAIPSYDLSELKLICTGCRAICP
jgi:hypothetical protein